MQEPTYRERVGFITKLSGSVATSLQESKSESVRKSGVKPFFAGLNRWLQILGTIAQSHHVSVRRARWFAPESVDVRSGEIRKIDKETGKLTIKHGEIKNLDMPPMTMVFTAKEKTLLDKVQAGDKVKFAAVHEGGKMVVIPENIES